MSETRRRGAALEHAILDAAWAELVERGYSGMSFESVSERAQTSKPVLYRRWPTKEALLVAALGQRGIMTPSDPPDTGSLRGDVIAILQAMNRIGDSIAGFFSGLIGSYFAETDTNPAELRAMVFGDQLSGMQKVIAQAERRGELPPGVLPARLISLPSDLVRNELVMTLKAVPESAILDIVDTIFLPLVKTFTTGFDDTGERD